MILHSQIFGAGKPFLILHGFLGMGDNWKTLGRKFAELEYEVHLIDQRNHGRSFHDDAFGYDIMAEDIKTYCSEKKLTNIVLLGHSMGGKTAMQFAVNHPEKVSKLIVADIGPKAYPLHHQDILKALSSLDFSIIKSREEADNVLSEYIPELGTRLFLLKNLYRPERDKFGLRINLPVLSENIEAIGKAIPPDSHYDGPTLFLGGSKSSYILPTDELNIKNHFPKAQIKTISNAGHWLHAENPTEFYQYVTNFL